MKEVQGLSSVQVEHNLAQYGNNKLTVKESATFLEMFVESFKDKWILILLGALGIEMLFNTIKTLYPQIGESEWLNSFSIAIAILLSTGFATISSYSAEKKFNALKDQSSKIPYKVYRNGKLVEVMVDDITFYDLILVQTGDKIPVDGILIDGHLKVDQASLNGESEEAKKVVGSTDKFKPDDLFSEYSVFRGTVVTEGEAIIQALVLGDKTVLGSINSSLQEDKKQSPSKHKLEKLADGIGVMGYSAGGLYFVINIVLGYMALQSQGLTQDYMAIALLVMKTLMFAVTIVIMAVPEGLPMMLAMVASMNSGRLLRENILVRNPDSIETAGYTNILFSDKTGTLTNGVLSVVDFIDGEGGIYQSLNSINPKLKEGFILAMGLNNDAQVIDGKALGSNGTDRALLQYLIDNDLLGGVDKSRIVEKEQFTSTNKYASVTTDVGIKYLKGAAEVLLANSTHFIKDGKVTKLTQKHIDKLNEISVEQANRSMRLLALQYQTDEQKVLIGLVCIRDNMRDGMADTIKELNQAGVQVVMVTGDRKETAIAIAKECGIIQSENDVALTHDELAQLSDQEVKNLMHRLKVVSRALPMDKKRLVDLAHDLGMVCGMTGDGSNDSPALKSSDVGFSMGDGTQVAQEASDVVIVNNSLSSIEKAILNGRTMTKSVQKFIIFQLTVNVATILTSIIAPLVGFHEPFTIVQVLWINLIMDTLAALAFGGEPTDKAYLKEKPIARNESLVTGYMKSNIAVSALFIALGVLGIWLNVFGLHDLISDQSEPVVRTFIFTFFIYAIIFNGFNTRNKGFNVLKNITKNPKFLVVMIGIGIAQSLIIQYGGAIFSTVQMNLHDFLLALGLAFLIVPIDMIRKVFVK